MKKHKWFKIMLLILAGVIAIGLIIVGRFLRLDAYLPHDKITIILPFEAKYDSVTSMIPMGETVYHPKPNSPRGHPGIDFGSQELFPFIASVDGTISMIDEGGSSDGSDVYLSKGAYNIVYKEMDTNNIFVKVGQKVKQGDEIALPNPKVDGGNTHYSTHWEFASASPIRDRYCPLTYFTPESKARIEVIWENVGSEAAGGIKQKFPHICSGDYFGRVE